MREGEGRPRSDLQSKRDRFVTKLRMDPTDAEGGCHHTVAEGKPKGKEMARSVLYVPNVFYSLNIFCGLVI